jgi:MFS transporter, YNFM family, putative membrane transport protein
MFTDPRHLAVALAGGCAFLNLYAPQAVLPLLAQEFRVGAAEISLIMTVSTMSVALTAPFTGAVADVVGRKVLIASAAAALVVPSAMVAFAPTLEWLLFWRFVQGLLLPPIFTVTIAYIGDEWPSAEKTAVASIYLSASSFAGFLGRFITGILSDAVGWRGAFLADACITALFAAGIILLLPREKKFVGASSLSASLTQMVRHLGNKRLIATYAIGFGVLFNFIVTFTFVNFLLAAPPFNLSPSWLGAIFLVYLVGAAVTPQTSRLIDRFGRRRFIFMVFGVWICGLLLLLVPSLPVIVLALAIAAACGFFGQAIATTYVAVTAREGTSSAVGLYVTSFYVGGAVGAYLGGFAWKFAGWPGAVALAIGMLGLMALIVATTWPSAPERAK